MKANMTHHIWKTIDTSGKPKLKGVNMSSWAKDMLAKVKFPKKGEVVDLVKISVRELGFTTWTTYADITAKAKEQGLDLCPPQLAPWLREIYRDQPRYEWITVAMDPIADQGGYPSVFHVVRPGDGLCLRGDFAGPADGWYPEDAFVFRLRKSVGTSDPLHSDTLDLETLTSRVEALEDWKKSIQELP